MCLHFNDWLGATEIVLRSQTPSEGRESGQLPIVPLKTVVLAVGVKILSDNGQLTRLSPLRESGSAKLLLKGIQTPTLYQNLDGTHSAFKRL